MQIKREDIKTALCKKGFIGKPGDHNYFHLYVDGKRSNVFTYLSHGSGYREYGDELIDCVKDEMRITKPEFLRFIDCALNGDEYVELLKQRGKIRNSSPIDKKKK